MMRRLVPAGLSMIALTVALAACSGGGAGVPSNGGAEGSAATPPTDTGAAGSTPGTTSSGAVTGHVGDKLTFGDSAEIDGQVDATLVKVFDPATQASADDGPPPSGARWVGIEVTIVNRSSQGGLELLTVTGRTSDGSTVTTGGLQGGFEACTQTSTAAERGVPYTRCLAFVVPDGQILVQVEIPHSLSPGDQATWTVP